MYGSMECLKCLREKKCRLDIDTCIKAAEYGQLE